MRIHFDLGLPISTDISGSSVDKKIKLIMLIVDAINISCSAFRLTSEKHNQLKETLIKTGQLGYKEIYFYL